MNLEILYRKPVILTGILILFYSVGLGLYFIPQTRSLFNILTPFSLMLSFGAVLLFQKKWTTGLGISFGIVFVGSIIIEILGVSTGILFGEYVYGSSLGLKIFDTPILIGLNWLILIYCTASIVNHIFKNIVIRILAGSALMVTYDVLLEYVAPVMDMWFWESRYPGIRNFLMWFFVALIFHTLFQKLNDVAVFASVSSR